MLSINFVQRVLNTRLTNRFDTQIHLVNKLKKNTTQKFTKILNKCSFRIIKHTYKIIS